MSKVTKIKHDASSVPDWDMKSLEKTIVSDETQTSDAESDNEDSQDNVAFEIKRLKALTERADELYKLEEWSTSERYIQSILKTLEKPFLRYYKNPDTGSHSRTDWLLTLLEVQNKQNKWSDGLGTVAEIERTSLNECAVQSIPGLLEYWRSLFYFRLGDLELAQRLCKKAVKRRQKDPSSEKWEEAVQLMVQILAATGDDIEMHVYLSWLPPQKRVLLLPQAQHRPEIYTPSTTTDDGETLYQESEDGEIELLAPVDIEEKRRILQEWELDIGPDGRILMKSEQAIDNAINHIINNNDKALADIIFDDVIYDSDHMTPLHRAINQNNIEMVKLLLEKGAPTLSLTSKGWSALVIAIWKASNEMVEFLLELGLLGNGKGQGRNFELVAACRHDIDDRVLKIKALLEKGADVNQTSESGFAPLMALSTCVDKEDGRIALAMLLKTGINVNQVDHNGDTALHYGAEFGKTDYVVRLLQAGADASIKNKQGETPLDLASNGSLIQRLLTLPAAHLRIDTSERNF
ncbi:Ankyrin-2 [Dactylellina cionopaga]|nr:Ankyrin-2 [Dactylellina cionopaga]